VRDRILKRRIRHSGALHLRSSKSRIGQVAFRQIGGGQVSVVEIAAAQRESSQALAPEVAMGQVEVLVNVLVPPTLNGFVASRWCHRLSDSGDLFAVE